VGCQDRRRLPLCLRGRDGQELRLNVHLRIDSPPPPLGEGGIIEVHNLVNR
jgi:hypothetical protein